MPYAQGVGSCSLPGIAGESYQVARISAYFTSAGQSGTLTMKEGTTTVWSASVSGGLFLVFPGRWTIATGASVSLEMAGATLWIAAGGVGE